MRQIIITLAMAAAAILSLTAQPSAAQQQGSGSSRTAPPARTAQPTTPDEFYKSFWTYLNRAESPYKSWTGTEAMKNGEPPHGALIKTHVNKLVADSPKNLPYGAILVADNYADDGKTLQSVMVMFRIQGRDPQHFDWYWLQYQPDGSISLTSPEAGKKAIAGKVSSCIDCHAKAKGGDYVHLYDEPAPEGR